MWSHLPIGQLHKAALKAIEANLADLRQQDPTGYYQGDLNDLLDRHATLTERLNPPFS